ILWRVDIPSAGARVDNRLWGTDAISDLRLQLRISEIMSLLQMFHKVFPPRPQLLNPSTSLHCAPVLPSTRDQTPNVKTRTIFAVVNENLCHFFQALPHAGLVAVSRRLFFDCIQRALLAAFEWIWLLPFIQLHVSETIFLRH